ncbi:MFS transporter [Pseudorhodoferax aquiterrae]|uniref:MFS transporter n=1 Tax=Pseudorhodoferax aquiterrae TaxID=747304 RepID=A0ABQ3FZS0_9BURK|nr:tripartite tricarboxylate transporter substrate binding protein [Pseudorhodoferax aquiterrae]GHC78939.1 MFS transporter [Pseudorhodoferax aquiterrae]
MPRSAFHRRHLLALCASAAFLPSVHAQAYPNKPIRVVVPYQAGGATDVIARVFGDKLAARLGQPVVIDNKAGAGGILGTDTVAKAAPDGYTLLVTLSTSILINQFLYTKLPYNPQKELALVSQLAAAPITLAVHPSVPVKTGPELLAYMAAHKGKVSYGSYGIGSHAHLAGAHMSRVQNADMVHVAYKGEAPMLQDLIGGQVQMAYASALGVKPHAETGRLRIVGVTGPRRMSVLPEVPTLLEQGMTDDVYGVVGFIGMAAPAGTPREIVERVAREVQAIGQMEDVRARITSMGFETAANGVRDFEAVYKKDLPIWQKLVQESGARLD